MQNFFHSFPFVFTTGYPVRWHSSSIHITVTPKKTFPYNISYIFTDANNFFFRWTICVQLFLCWFTVSHYPSHRHFSSSSYGRVFMHCICYVDPSEQLMNVQVSYDSIIFHGTIDKNQNSTYSFQSSMSLLISWYSRKILQVPNLVMLFKNAQWFCGNAMK